MSYDIPSISELEAIQLLNKHYAEVVTSKKDGIASGSDITQTTNPITGVVRRTLYKILDDMDETFLERLLKMAFTPVGTFTEGATLTDARQILLWEVSQGGDGHYYSWSGTFPKAVTAGSSPSPIEAGSWVDRTDVTLRLDLASESGSELVGYQPSGNGAVATTVQSKLREFVSVKDFGAVGDGVADDRTAINLANATGLDVQTSSATYKATNTITFGSAATYRAGRAAVHNNSSGFSYRVGAGSDIEGGTWNATGGVAFDLQTSAVDVSLRNLKINNSSSSNAIAINVNAAGVKNLRIHGASITTKGYGVLTNSGGTVDGMIVSASCISSEADAVELNAPGVDHRNIAVIGSLLRANGPGINHASGFAVGIAGAKNAAIVGNVIPESTWEAIHVEDRQDTIAVVANVGQNMHGDFLRAAVDGSSGTGGKGFPVIGNNVKSYAAGLANYGAWMVYNANGSLPGMTLMGNRFAGFEAGIRGGRGNFIAIGNVLESCGAEAVLSDGGGFIYGTNLAISTPTLVKSTEGTVIGRVVSDTPPTTILDTSGHAAGAIGTVLEEGFAFRGLAATLGASTVTAVRLFALPKLMKGRLIVRVKHIGSHAYIYASADVMWNGTTLTVSNALKDEGGSIAWSGTTFTASDGFLQMPIYNAGASVNTLEDVIFKGEYYK